MREIDARKTLLLEIWFSRMKFFVFQKECEVRVPK